MGSNQESIRTGPKADHVGTVRTSNLRAFIFFAITKHEMGEMGVRKERGTRLLELCNKITHATRPGRQEIDRVVLERTEGIPSQRGASGPLSHAARTSLRSVGFDWNKAERWRGAGRDGQMTVCRGLPKNCCTR